MLTRNGCHIKEKKKGRKKKKKKIKFLTQIKTKKKFCFFNAIQARRATSKKATDREEPDDRGQRFPRRRYNRRGEIKRIF